MKYILTLFLFSKAVFAFGQSSIDLEQLINNWTQGKIDQNGTVVKADINRGGWYQLNINSDTTVIFEDPFTCGFGHKRDGKWQLNKLDKTATFTFFKSIGYMNSPGTVNINEMEIYKIKKLTSDELILSRRVGESESIMPFIKAIK